MPGRERDIRLEPGDVVRIVAVPAQDLESALQRADSPRERALRTARIFIRANDTALSYLEGADPYDETLFDIGAAQQLRDLFLDLDKNGITQNDLEAETTRMFTQDLRSPLPRYRAEDKAQVIAGFIFKFGSHLKEREEAA